MRYVLLIFCLLITGFVYPYTLRDDAPAQYRIQYGDTLWDIANRYLKYPWEWQALWHANPRIKNPNRLHPGDIIELRYHQNNPYLKILTKRTIKLSPYPRPEPEEIIPPIPLADLKPFLDGSLILDKNSLAEAPFVIAFTTEHLIGGQGDEVYVKNLCPPNFVLPKGETISYAIYRPCGIYKEPTNQSFLGYKAVLVGYAELVRGGDPATVVLTDIVQGVRLQDRVMPNNHPSFDLYFEPRTPSVPVRGAIIDVLGDFSQGAVGLVVVINRGQDAGLMPGDVLGAYSRPKTVKNMEYHYKPKGPCQFPCTQLPPERIGEVMIFRTFSRTSIALVVRSIRSIALLDIVTNP